MGITHFLTFLVHVFLRYHVFFRLTYLTFCLFFIIFDFLYFATKYSFLQDLRFIGNPASLSFGDDFKEKLGTFAGCTLPEILKMDICKLIQNHCFNSGLSINLDVHSVNALPDNLKSCFCKLLTHAYSIDSRSQQLVLDLMKLVADTIATGDENIKEDSSQHVNAVTQLQNSPNVKYPGKLFFHYALFSLLLVLVCSITS